MMKKYSFIVVLNLIVALSYAQDCIDYQLLSCPRIKEHQHYTVVPEGSKSILMKKGETMELSFSIHQGKDYRITTCSDLHDGKVTLKIYDGEDNTLLLYDNELNDMIQSFEFQVVQSRRVRVVVGILEDKTEQKINSLLIEKMPRGCVGLLLESMITRK